MDYRTGLNNKITLHQLSEFAPEYLVRPSGTPWSNTGGTHFHVAAERLINFSGIPNQNGQKQIDIVNG